MVNQLYIIPGSCSTGIHALMNKLHMPVEIIKRDEITDYQMISPTNQVPALKQGERVMTEGAAIVLHLYQSTGQTPMLEGDTSDFYRWLMFNYATLHPAYSKLFTMNTLMEGNASKQQVLQALGNRVSELWQIVDKILGTKPFMHGTEPGIIDYLLAVYLRWGNVFTDVRIPVSDGIIELVNRVQQAPEFSLALKKEGIEYRIPDNATV